MPLIIPNIPRTIVGTGAMPHCDMPMRRSQTPPAILNIIDMIVMVRLNHTTYLGYPLRTLRLFLYNISNGTRPEKRHTEAMPVLRRVVRSAQ